MFFDRKTPVRKRSRWRNLAATLFAGAAMCATAPVFASSHSDIHRIATKALLTQAVDTYCTSESSECTTLRETVSALYADPSVVTRDDVARIDVLKSVLAQHNVAWRVMFANVRGDLLAAIDKAETLTYHVLYLHDGKWERFESCDMPS